MWKFLTIKVANKDIKAKENFADNHGHKTFFSPQVKRSVIISNKTWYVPRASRLAEQLKT